MAAYSKEDVLKRAGKAWSRKTNWDDMLDDAYDHALPQRDLYDEESEGSRKISHLFDSTGCEELDTAANTLVDNLFPAYKRWAKLKCGAAVPKAERKKKNEEYEGITDLVFSVLQNRSNFQTSINEVALEQLISTGVMLIQKGNLEKPVLYQAIPQKQVALEQGVGDEIGAVYRKRKMPIRLIKPTWPKAVLDPALEKRMKDDTDAEIEIHEATYRKYDEDGQVYYEILVKDGDDSYKVISEKRRIWPWVISRMVVAANEIYGRGPLLKALPNIKTLNKLVEMVLRNASLAVSGTYTYVDDGVINPDKVRIGPMQFIPVERNPGHPSGPSIAPLERSGSFDVAYMEYERIQNSIKRIMMNEDLPPMDGAPRTAAEILERVRRYSKNIGGAFGRLVQEQVVPIMQITIDILYHDWQLINQEVNIDGIWTDIEVMSPLAMQQNLNDVENVVRALQISLSLFGPQVTYAAFEVKGIPGYIAGKLGMPEEFIRDVEDVEGLEQMFGAAAGQLEQQEPGAGLAAMQGAIQPSG